MQKENALRKESNILKNEKSRLLLSLAGCFAVTFLCLYVVFRSAGIGLSGPRSILISDMQTQYIDFFMALRNGDIFYANGIGLSGSFAGTFAYYLSSPLSLVIFLFPKEQLQTALLLLISLKMSLASATFGYMVYRLFQKRATGMLLFSAAYSLMSFVFFFFINLFWLDAFIWLPRLAIETTKLAETGKVKWLPLFLGLLFLSNFYISYIVGLFLLLFFLYLAISRNLPLKETAVRVGKLALSALAGALLSAVTLLPAVKNFSRSFGVEAFDGYGTFNFTPKQFLLKLFNGSYDSIGNFAAPTIFCGMLIFILSICFFFLKSIKRREKIAAGGMILLFLASFLLPALDKAWHGFSYPNAFAYRYVFCFCFFLLYIAIKAFLHVKEIPNWLLLLFFIPAAAIIVFRNTLQNNLSAASVAATLAALVVYPVLLLLIKNTRIRSFSNIACGMLAVLTVLELSLNGGLILRGMDNPESETGYPFPRYADWVDDYDQSRALLEHAEDLSLYRAANTDPLKWNEGLALRYNGVSSFSSDYDPKIQRLYSALGYGGSFKGYWYQPGSLFADSFFGVRYVISESDISYMNKIAEDGMLALYENEHALPVAFCANSKIADFMFSDDAVDNRDRLLDNLILSELSDISEAEKLSKIRASALDTTLWGGKKIEGTITVPRDCVLQTTLPFDRNYTIKIDGEKVETFETLDCLLAAKIVEGNHVIEISYFPKEALIGGIVSFASLAGWIWFSLEKKRGQLPTG